MFVPALAKYTTGTRWSHRLLLLLGAWLLLLPGPLHAHLLTPDAYVQRLWQSSDGLASNSVESVVQTRDGYLWVATDRGLCRFDGARFDVFKPSDGSGVPENYISTLFEARDGTLWIGTALNRLVAYKNGRFVPVPLPVSGRPGKIIAIREDREGTLWIGTKSQGLLTLTRGSVRTFPAGAASPGNSIRSVVVDGQGTVWVASVEAGVQSFSGAAFRTLATPQALGGEGVSSLGEDPGGALWIAAGRNLFTLGPGGTLHGHPGLRARQPIHALYWTGQDELWLGMDGGGLEQHKSGHTRIFTSSNGYAIDNVQSLVRDREGSLWVGTDSEGLVQLRVASFANYDVSSGNSKSHLVRALAPDQGSAFWVGTPDGLHHWDGGFRSVPLDPGARNKDVRSLFRDRQGTLWVGTDGSGLMRLTPGAPRALAVPLRGSSPTVMAIAEDARANLWVGTPDGLLVLPEGRPEQVLRQPGLPSQVILALRLDHAGCVWIGTAHGLARKCADGPLQTFPTAPAALAQDSILCIYEDPDGIVWIGTFDGLYRWTGDRFVRRGVADGLASDVVVDILSGQTSDELWLRSNGEISRVRRSALLRVPPGGIPTQRFNHQDGIPSVTSASGFPGSLRLDDGTLWFATTKGLVSPNPALLGNSNPTPPVVVTRVSMDGVPWNLNDASSMPPSRGDLEFDFAALSFVEHEKLRFKYKLEGFESNWTDAGSRTAAYYTNLPPGHYTFRVLAAGRDGNWNLTGAARPFILRAHLYQNAAFQALCALVALAIAGMGVRWRSRSREAVLLSEQKELAQLVAVRTAELEEEKELLLSAREHLRQQARHDGLTGLLNRTVIVAALEDEFTRARRTGRSLTVAMVDIDHFKSINDTFGHLVGDDVLQGVSACLQKSVRPYDFVGRYGGEEFLLILPGFDATREQYRLEDLRGAIHRAEFRAGPNTFVVSCSIGVCTLEGECHTTAVDLLAAADAALYQAKRAGRNRVVYQEAIYSH